MFEVRIPSRAKRQIKSIKKIYQQAILSALEEIGDDPFVGKPLERDLKERFSYRIGVYRIVYKINKDDKVVNILFAGHRSTVYD